MRLGVCRLAGSLSSHLNDVAGDVRVQTKGNWSSTTPFRFNDTTELCSTQQRRLGPKARSTCPVCGMDAQLFAKDTVGPVYPHFSLNVPHLVFDGHGNAKTKVLYAMRRI